MSFQVDAFHDSVYDAIAADVTNIGGVKKVAAMLWPTNSDAASRLRSCLSTEHPQKLDAEELLTIKRLARNIGSFATVAYEARDLGYTFEWIKPEDHHAELQREFIDAVHRAEKLAQLLKGRP